ncbi:MAG: hypothetical protein HC912_01655 [Saprospiraceae bacterium]|nr:hypothetical protein [Saprospiraceae bacterium]
MSLNEDGTMISHINTVIEKFAAAKRLTLGASMPASGTNAPTDSPD